MSEEAKKRTANYKPGDRLSASWVQKVENFISSFRVLSGGRFVFDGRNAVLQIYNQGFLGLFAFGIKSFNAAENKVKINQGIIKKGSMTRIVEEAEIPVTGDPAFVILKVNKNTADGEWISTSVSTVPADTQTETYLPFYEYENSAPQGSPVKMKLSRIHRIGSVFL